MLTGYSDFRSSAFPAPVVSWDRLRHTFIPMEDIRRRLRVGPPDQDFVGDLTEIIETINRMPVNRVGSAELSYIMAMATRPGNIRQLGPAVLAY